MFMSGNQRTLDMCTGAPGAVLRVSEVCGIIAGLLDDPQLRGIRVRGEVTNYKNHMSGHRYFSLSERSPGGSAVLNCVMWRTDAARLGFEPADGMTVIAYGEVGHYAPQGKYQFYVKEMDQAGIGEKYLLVEKWKKELGAEGVFSAERKVPLPQYPARVGVVTSGTGAVLHDIRNVLARRYPVEIVLCPTQVQGDLAHTAIADSIRRMDACGVDVMIVARGGGSFEDLFPFNHPDVVHAIAACRTPVISAIGHEVDVTLADFAADVRAPTPSAAAELAVPDRAALIEELSRFRRQMKGSLEGHLVRAGEAVRDLRDRLHPRKLLRKVADRREFADAIAEQLGRSYRSRLTGERLSLGKLGATIEAINPRRTLERGYCLVEKDGHTIRSVERVQTGDRLVVRFADGTAETSVEKVNYGTDL